MRKALIAVAVATALFAVGAFAASFAMQAEDTASGTNPVTSCADSASVDFTETFVPADNNWNITSVTVTLQGAADCVSGDVQLVLQDNTTGEPVVLDQTKLNIADAANGVSFAGEVLTLTFTPAGALPVSSVDNAAVLVNGLQLSTTPA